MKMTRHDPLFDVASPLTIGLLISLVILAGHVALKLIWRRPPLPPGPKGRFPILGMTFDMPKQRPWLQLSKWAEIYGPIMHIRVGMQDFIYISSGEIAREFLDKRSSIYSSRPPSVVGDIITRNMRSVLMPYDSHWRAVRRIFAGLLTAKKCDTYTSILEREAVSTLHDLILHPEVFAEHIYRSALSVARSVAYGRRVPRSDDPFARGIKQMMENFSKAMTPGRYIIESIPVLRNLPLSMQPWMKELGDFRDFEESGNLNNYRKALEDAEKFPDRKSVAKDIKNTRDGFGEMNELQAATTCNEILGVGSETTATSMLAMVHACVAFPETVRKAHEELDRVVGRKRLPTWQDEPDLPYIRAMVKEQHRWRTIAPLSFRHYSTSEDIYNGYRIPKGSVVTMNTWAIHMDAKRYHDPQRFNPDRFLNHQLGASAYANSSNVDARDHFSYGSGKRICVGIHLAERSLFIMTARLLQVFDIKPGLDAQGNVMQVDINAYQHGLVSGPEPFAARFVPRNDEVRATLETEWSRLFGNGEVDSWDGE